MKKVKCNWSRNRRWTEGKVYEAQVGGSGDGFMTVSSDGAGYWTIQPQDVPGQFSYIKVSGVSASFTVIEE